MENGNTPDTSSQGQAPSSADAGFVAPTNVSGQGQQTQGIGNQPQNSLPPEIQQQSVHFNQKITEMGQANAELRQQIAAIQSENQQRQQALAQALGVAPKEQEPDIWSNLSNDPNYIQKTVQQLVQQQMMPLQQQIEQTQVKEYLLEQNSTKEQLRGQLSQYLSEAEISKVMDVTPFMDPSILAQAQQIQNLPPHQRGQAEAAFNVEIARAFQRAGGVEALVERNLGRVLNTNFPQFVQSVASTMSKRQYQAQRPSGSMSFTGGAGTAQPTSGGINITSESVFV